MALQNFHFVSFVSLFLSLLTPPPPGCYGTADTVSQIFEVHYLVLALVINYDLILYCILTCTDFSLIHHFEISMLPDGPYLIVMKN